jgi:RNA polymerase sigma factor for flagellar operon FliA
MDAIEKFDLDKGVKFETYAATRIRGSIFDEIRDLDWVPRTVRAKARDIERAEQELHASLGRPPEDAELATHLGITLLELWTVQTQTEAGRVDTYDASPYFDSGHLESAQIRMPVEADTPESLFDTAEVADLLADAIDLMPQRFKTILTLYYLQGMTLAQIGDVLGVTESRVCQLQSKLLQTLHASLSQGLMAA